MERVRLFSFSPKLRNLDWKKFSLCCYPRCGSISCLQMKICEQISILHLVLQQRNFEITLEKRRFKLAEDRSWTHAKVALTLVFTRACLQQLVELQQQFALNHLNSEGIRPLKSKCFHVLLLLESLNHKYNCCAWTNNSGSEGAFWAGPHWDFFCSFHHPNFLRMPNPRVLLQLACLQPVRRHTWE